MSDILIRGMEMPKDIEPGLVIEFADGIDGKRYARLYHYRHGGLTEWLEAISTTDVRPVVKATWIVKEMQALLPGMDEHPVFVCSECGYQIYDLFDSLKERHHFCPSCGAGMDTEEDE